VPSITKPLVASEIGSRCCQAIVGAVSLPSSKLSEIVAPIAAVPTHKLPANVSLRRLLNRTFCTEAFLVFDFIARLNLTVLN